jgi:hypothetical protein
MEFTHARPASLRAAHEVAPDLSRKDAFASLARPGLIARGVVYGVIGVLAIKVAVGSAGTAPNQQGALQAIARQPFGKLLLIALAVGLAGYAGWRLVRAATGRGAEERDSGLKRLAAAGSALAYGALFVVAVKVLAASASGSSSNPSEATAGVMGWSGGPVIVGLAGTVLIGVGLYQGYRALARKFLDEANTDQMSRQVKRAYEVLGIFGHLARMVVFGLTGYGLLGAAIEFDPHKAVGLDGALRELADHSYGPLLLGIVAAGLIGFALFSTAEARFRRV